MSPALNGSSAIRRFECSNVIEIRDGITFDFYMGLPHLDFIAVSQWAIRCLKYLCLHVHCTYEPALKGRLATIKVFQM